MRTNNPFHRIAALLRFLLNLKVLVVGLAAEGWALGRSETLYNAKFRQRR
jgi:hypothetical protein